MEKLAYYGFSEMKVSTQDQLFLTFTFSDFFLKMFGIYPSS